MKKLFFILLLLPWMARASTIINATITITNAAGTTNGQTLTVNSAVRTWTNAVFVPATQILTNATVSGAAQNLLLHLNSHPFAGLSLLSSTTNSVTITTTNDGPSPVISLSAGWGTFSLVTNTLGPGVVVRVPYTVEAVTQRTNVASGVGAMINSSANTNLVLVWGTNVSGAVPQATHATNSDLATVSVLATNVSTPAGYSHSADVVITNGIYFATNAFPSATNSIDFNKARQFFSTVIPLSITGFANMSPIQDRTVVLRVFNSESTNITVDWPTPVTTTDGSRSATVTNGHWRVFTFSGVATVTTNAATVPLW